MGPGGLKCPCCNDYRGKTKNNHVGQIGKLNKVIRHKLKQQLKKQWKDNKEII